DSTTNRINPKKAQKLILSLKNRSNEIRADQLESSRKASSSGLKRDLLPASTPTVKASVKVNISGNRRGMHNLADTEHMRKVRAMRQFYGPKLPVLACSTCAFATSCPAFKAGYECSFLP